MRFSLPPLTGMYASVTVSWFKFVTLKIPFVNQNVFSVILFLFTHKAPCSLIQSICRMLPKCFATSFNTPLVLFWLFRSIRTLISDTDLTIQGTITYLIGSGSLVKTSIPFTERLRSDRSSLTLFFVLTRKLLAMSLIMQGGMPCKPTPFHRPESFKPSSNFFSIRN